MMNSKNLIEQEYPLSYYIWQNDYKKLKNLLSTPLGQVRQPFIHRNDSKKFKKVILFEPNIQKLIEKRDIRGRTPLMLACTLGHFECAKLLMNSNAIVNIDDDDGFNVLHEAIATNDPELVQLVLEKREYQRSSNRAKAIPALLRKIRDVRF